MGLFRLIRRAAPLVALGAAGVVAARRRAASRPSFDLPAPPTAGPAPGPVVVEEPPSVEPPPVGAPPVEPPVAEDVTVVGSVVEEAPDEAATGARSEQVADEEPTAQPTVVRSVYDAPPVAAPAEDPLEQEPPVERPDAQAAPTTINDVVDDLLAPPSADDRIEDATLVEDEAGEADRRA